MAQAVTVFSTEGEDMGEVELPDSIFAVEVNEGLLHEAVVMYENNRRQGTAKTKTRSERRGGGRKPWRQKGTGRARHGSIRSPIWKGGGVVFGPTPRDYSYHMPKKKRLLALRSALSAKAADAEIHVIDDIQLERPKTRRVASMLADLGLSDQKVLVVVAEYDVNVYRSVRNIPGVDVQVASDLNVYDVLAHDDVLLTREALVRIGEVLNGA